MSSKGARGRETVYISAMDLITQDAALKDACTQLRAHPYVAVDTEFLRETTYWPKLCLVQAATPQAAFLIDPLAEGLDLGPLLSLMADPGVVKVFHAGRQDIEIFVRLMGRPPTSVFDTQIAAMACGHGDSIAYDALVAAVVKGRIDKSSRFTDWSRRPLSDEQLRYALADVTYLCGVYEKLSADLQRRNRSEWLTEEMAALLDPAAYDTTPENAWKRLKPRKTATPYLAAFAATCAWRERAAQARDQPRGRILKDDVIYEIAEQRPRSVDQLSRLRALPKGWAQSRLGQDLALALDRALSEPDAHAPKFDRPPPAKPGIGPVIDLLKVLLKQVADDEGVAPRLIANAAELEAIASDDADGSPALHGWRRRVFGERALALKRGEIALVIRGKRVVTLPTPPSAAPAAKPAASPAAAFSGSPSSTSTAMTPHERAPDDAASQAGS
jgi:ribonuclease D